MNTNRQLEALAVNVSAAKPKFTHMSDTDYAPLIALAVEIRIVSLANFRFIAANSGVFHEFVSRGGTLREILLDTTDASAMASANRRSIGSSKKPGHTRAQVDLTLDKLAELSKNARAGGLVEVKQAPYATAHVITLITDRTGTETAYVVPTGFEQRTEDRPTIVIERSADAGAYVYFSDYFLNLWQWPESKSIKLASKRA